MNDYAYLDETSVFQLRFAPDWAQPVLEWASPRFEAAFVFLHPFVRVPADLTESIEPDGNRWLETDFDLLVSSGPIHIKWEEVRSAVSRLSLAHLLADINANAIGCYPGTATEESVRTLLKYLRANHILAPVTHYLPFTLKPAIEASIEKYGKPENLLYVTPYECPYSFICSSKDVLQCIVSDFNFDGFFADDSTLFDWKAGAAHKRVCQSDPAKVLIFPPFSGHATSRLQPV